ncbi:hypothetical protein BD769DRAFT_1386678 [Suillus cothurnatus]|nr:hypothetical protein BD769DRAFT_1386678 [Suillus cothurnatus]
MSHFHDLIFQGPQGDTNGAMVMSHSQLICTIYQCCKCGDFGQSLIGMFDDNIEMLNGIYTKGPHVYHSLMLDNTRLLAVDYCPTEEMVADIMTKALPKEKHQKFTKSLVVPLMTECSRYYPQFILTKVVICARVIPEVTELLQGPKDRVSEIRNQHYMPQVDARFRASMNQEKNNIQHAFETVLHPNFFLPLPRFSICVSHHAKKFSIKGYICVCPMLTNDTALRALVRQLQ